MDVVFSGFTVLCIQLVLWNKDAVLSIIPRDTKIGRFVLLWTYRLYRYLSLLVLSCLGSTSGAIAPSRSFWPKA
ncbi:MAG: hypothetical protein H6727_02725 [Myxococcales bacterium]|nr:hypothetical protein [Myxococcales bacterium]